MSYYITILAMNYSHYIKKISCTDLLKVNHVDFDLASYELTIDNNYNLSFLADNNFKKIILSDKCISADKLFMIVFDIISKSYTADTYDIIFFGRNVKNYCEAHIKYDGTIYFDLNRIYCDRRYDVNNPTNDILVCTNMPTDTNTDSDTNANADKLPLSDLIKKVMKTNSKIKQKFYCRIDDLVRSLLKNCCIHKFYINDSIKNIIGCDSLLKYKFYNEIKYIDAVLEISTGTIINEHIFDYYTELFTNSNIIDINVSNHKQICLSQYLIYLSLFKKLETLRLDGDFTISDINNDAFDLIRTIIESNPIKTVRISANFIEKFPDIFILFDHKDIDIEKIYLSVSHANYTTWTNILTNLSGLNITKLCVRTNVTDKLNDYFLTFLLECEINSIKIIYYTKYISGCVLTQLLRIFSNKHITNISIESPDFCKNTALISFISSSQKPGSFDHLQKIKINLKHFTDSEKICRSIEMHLTKESELLYLNAGVTLNNTTQNIINRNISQKQNRIFKHTKAIMQ